MCNSLDLDLTDSVGESLRIGHRGYSIGGTLSVIAIYQQLCCTQHLQDVTSPVD
jgi:hypothetical protein